MELFGPWQDSYGGGDSFSFDLFGGGNGLATDGQIAIDQRANTSFIPFDQSKLGSSLFDVMSSGAKSLADTFGKTLGRVAGDAISPGSASQDSFLTGFFRNFSSTKTGAQIQQQAIAGTIQGYMQNPIVWVILIAVIGLFFYSRR